MATRRLNVTIKPPLRPTARPRFEFSPSSPTARRPPPSRFHLESTPPSSPLPVRVKAALHPRAAWSPPSDLVPHVRRVTHFGRAIALRRAQDAAAPMVDRLGIRPKQPKATAAPQPANHSLPPRARGSSPSARSPPSSPEASPDALAALADLARRHRSALAAFAAPPDARQPAPVHRG